MQNFFKNISETWTKGVDLVLEFLKKYGWIFILAFGLALTTIGKSTMFFYKSGDFNSFLYHWMNRYKELGFPAALTNHFVEGGEVKLISDYTPFYYNILIILAQFVPVEGYVYAIKIVDLLFEISLSTAIFFITYHLYKNLTASSLFAVLGLIIPAIIINGPLWGQCDVIYVSFVVWSFYFLLKEKSWLSILMFSIAFSIKLQAIFFLPFLVLMMLKKKVHIYQFLLIPIIYFIFMLPNLIAGAGFGYLISIYGSQTGSYESIYLSAPSIYAFIVSNSTTAEVFGYFGIIACLTVTMCYVFYFFKKDIAFTPKNLITLATFVCLVTSFLLPRMHERYFILADIFSIIYLLMTKKGLLKAILINFASAMCTLNWVVGANFGQWYAQIGAALNLVALIIIITKELPNLELNIKDENTINAQ